MTTATNTNNRPVAELRDGSLKIAIFQGTTEKGHPYFSHKLTRSYRDQQGNWHDTDYLSGIENLQAANLRQLAYNKELQLKAQAKVPDGAQT